MLSKVMPQGRSALTAWVRQYGPGRYAQPAYRHIAAEVGIEAGAFLDLGCGPGWLAIFVAGGKPELDSIGIDTSAQMVALADRNKGPRLNVTFHEMPPWQIVFPDATFDAVGSVGSTRGWLPHVDEVLAEVHRVLKPGGRCLLYEPDPDGEIPDGWILRQGPWPPDPVLRAEWRRTAADAAQWDTLKSAVKASAFKGGEEGRHGYFRRLVLTR